MLAALYAAVAGAGEAERAAARGADLAACAAYYFNATKARPMAEYERLYGAGERALNRARRLLSVAEVDRLMAAAATEMTALTGADWSNFGRVSARWAEPCAALLGATSPSTRNR